jgi:Caspase domain
MTAMRLPYPDQSRAVLIGTSTFTGEFADHPLSSVLNNLDDLAAVLGDPVYGGFHKEHCVQVADEPLPKQILRTLNDTSKQATDVLLVYLASHAWPGDTVGNDLFVLLPDTDLADETWRLDALSFNDVRRIVRESPARIRMVIVDTCFSGIVLPESLGATQAHHFDVTGAYTLTAVDPMPLSLI